MLALGRKVGELIELRVEEGAVVATLTGTRLAPEVLRGGINLACGVVAG